MENIVNFKEIFDKLEDILRFDDDFICSLDDMTEEEIDTLTRIIAETMLEERKHGMDKHIKKTT